LEYIAGIIGAMSQLIKVGRFLMEIDGTKLSFFDAAGQPLGQPQEAADGNPILLPDGQQMSVEQLTEFLGSDDIADFQTAAGAENPAAEENPTEDSGGGRFAVFEDQQSIGGLTSIGGLQQTDAASETPADDIISDLYDLPTLESLYLPTTQESNAPVVTSEGSGTQIHITRVTVDQNPFGDNKVGDYLAAGGIDSKAVNPAMINGVNSANLTLAQSADVKVSFVSEGAGYKSMVGTYTFDANGNIDPASVKFLWLDATQAQQNKAGGALQKDFLGNSQPQDVSLGNLDANTRMGFFIVSDGASQAGNVSAIKALIGVDAKGNDHAKDLAAINSHLGFAKDANGNGQILLDGKALSGNVYFTHDKSLNTDNVKKDIEHTLSGVTTKPDGMLYVGFEDLAGGGDKDYDDVIIKVDIGSYNINKLSQTTTQPTVDLGDVDNTHLMSAIVTTQGFVAGDVLNLPSSSLFDVKADIQGHDVTYTVTAKGGVETLAAFEDFLNNAFFSTATATEGHRTISYQVTDADGLASNVSVADVHVTSSYEISVSELNGLAQLGSGDDTLHLNQALGKAIDFGAGHDTVHLAQPNTGFGATEAKLLDNVEVIDAQGAGSNKVAISIADVLDMTDGDHHLTILGEKGDSLVLTGDGAHHWTIADQGADFTTYAYNDGVNQAMVEVSNQMAQTVV
jgi:hypothetical protein